VYDRHFTGLKTEEIEAHDAVAAVGKRLRERLVHLPREQQSGQQHDDPLAVAVVVVDEPVSLQLEVAHQGRHRGVEPISIFPRRDAIDLGEDRMGATVRVQATVNGESRESEVEARLLLVHWLRDELGLTGAHVGCDTTNCGACTVHLNGEAVTGRVVEVAMREIQGGTHHVFVLDSGQEVPLPNVDMVGGAFLNYSKIIGRVVNREKAPNFGFTEANFLPEGSREGITGGVPEGMRAYTLEASRLSGVHTLRLGDKFDLMASVPVGKVSPGGSLAGSRTVATRHRHSERRPRYRRRRG
jgi:hypothetical protein